jgi:hypothetical protein
VASDDGVPESQQAEIANDDFRRILQCSTVKGACTIAAISWDEAWGILQRAVARGRARKEARPIPYIGVDEKAFRKGHRCMFRKTSPQHRPRIFVARRRTPCDVRHNEFAEVETEPFVKEPSESSRLQTRECQDSFERDVAVPKSRNWARCSRPAGVSLLSPGLHNKTTT